MYYYLPEKHFFHKTVVALFYCATAFLFSSTLFAQSVAIVGLDGDGGDEVSFVALRDFAAGEQLYFTEDEYSDASDNFNFDEGHLVYTAPAGGLAENTVVVITETGDDVFSVSGGGGTAVHVPGTGSWSFSGADEMYAYSASDPSSPWTTVTEIHCFKWTAVIAVPVDQRVGNDYPNAINIAINIGGAGAINADFNDAARVNTTLAMLIDPDNWTTVSGGVGITLSTTNFTNQMIVDNTPAVCPSVNMVEVSVNTICENAAFAVTANNLMNMAAAENNDQGYGVRFVAFDNPPADPYVGGSSLGSVSFGELTNGGSTANLPSASLPDEGTYSVYAVLSPTPDDTDCRPFAMSAELTVEDNPSVAIISPGDFCLDAGIQTGLSGGAPAGGIYAGPGVTDDGNGMTYSFDPAVAGVGTYTVSYTVPCGNMASASAEVFALPEVSFSASQDEFLLSDGVVTGLSGGTPIGGVYSGPGITDDGNGMTFTFDPEAAGAGVSTLTYSFTDGNGCSGSGNAEITVIAPALPGETCAEANDLNALFGQTPLAPQTSGLWDNSSYGTDASDPTFGYECFGEPDSDGGGPTLERTIWYSFIGDGNMYRITTVECNATDYIDSGDTQIAVYSGDCTTPVAVICDEDISASNFAASVELTTVAGTTYLMMIDGFGPNFNADGEFCVEVTNLTTVGVTDLATTGLRVFPNPTNGILQLPELEIERVEAYSATGQLMLDDRSANSSLDLTAQPSGLYLLKIYAADGVYTARVVKE